jgi:hypothetical protein
MTPKIYGFEIIIWTELPVLGRVVDYRMEYGASPVRDFNSMTAQLAEFTAAGVEFTVHPIMGYNP